MASSLSVLSAPMGAHLDRLPMELVFDILEFAAQSTLHTALSILLISRYCHRIAIPYVYQHVAIPWSAACKGFLRMIKEKPQLSTYTRSLWLESHILNIDPIKLCPNLTHLAIEPRSFMDYCQCVGENVAPFATPREVFLLPHPCDWSRLDTTHEGTAKVLESITSLWLGDPYQLFTGPEGSHVLAALSNVQRLAVNFDEPIPDGSNETPFGATSTSAILRHTEVLLDKLCSLKKLVLVFPEGDRPNFAETDKRRDSGFTNRMLEARHLQGIISNGVGELPPLSNRVYVMTLQTGYLGPTAASKVVLPIFRRLAFGQDVRAKSIWQQAEEYREALVKLAVEEVDMRHT